MNEWITMHDWMYNNSMNEWQCIHYELMYNNAFIEQHCKNERQCMHYEWMNNIAFIMNE